MKAENKKEELIRKVLEIVAKKRPERDQRLFKIELKKIRRDAVQLELTRWEMMKEGDFTYNPWVDEATSSFRRATK